MITNTLYLQLKSLNGTLHTSQTIQTWNSIIQNNTELINS